LTSLRRAVAIHNERVKLFAGFVNAIGLGLIGLRFELGVFYYAGVVVAVLLFAFQQFYIFDREPAHCFRAFLNNAWVGLAVFLGIALHYAFAG